MKAKIYTTGAFLSLAMVTLGGGCSASLSTNVVTTSSPAGANTAAKVNPAPPVDKKTGVPTAPGTKLQNEKKPENEKGKAAAQNVEVPKDWITVYDEKKGYSFSLPDGSTGGQETQDGVDTFVAMTPAPSELAVVVIAFNDQEMTKEDLLEVAVKFLEGLGAKKVETGKLAAESENYSLTVATSTLADGSKSKSKILVGTDVTDNYVMIVGAEEPKFAANEKIIDEIWGSFEMWSGRQ